MNGSDIAEMPEWLAREAGPPRPRSAATVPLVDEDDPAAIARAVAWLRDSAPDHGTFAVAAKVKDFGISQHMCGELMLEHWRDARDLGKDDEHVLFRVANAYRYGQNPVGVLAPEAEFEPVDVVDRRTVKVEPESDLIAGAVTLDDLRAVPPREWLYGDKLLRKYVTMLVSPGGVGKTAWTLAAALSCASGESLLGDDPHHAMNVWVYNLEDDIDEMRRRLRAALEYYGLSARGEVLDRLRLNSGRDRGLKIVRMRDDQFVVTPDKAKLVAEMLRNRIEVLVIDPFIYAHDLPENSNEAMGEALRQFNHIAQATGAAVLLVHHTKKGATAGDPESSRGAGAQIGGARKVLTMAKMAEEEAKRLDIAEKDRRLYVRVDSGKENMSPPPADGAEWFKLVSASLDNATAEYPKGDSVQVARRWTPPDPMLGLDEDRVAACLAAIEEGPSEGERYSQHARSTARYVVPLIAEHLEKGDSAAAQVLATWLKSGVLEEREYRSKATRSNAKGLYRGEQNATFEL